MTEHLIIVYRTVVLYFLVLVLMRIMGKREVGQLSLFDLVVAIMIAELAAIPMEDTSIELHHGVVPIVVLVFLEVALSFLTLKSQRARRIIEGTPSIIIEKGRVLENEMRRLRYNMDDMMAQMREQGVYNIGDVEYAILETNGKLSLVLKAAKRPVTPEDLGLDPGYEGLPIPLVSDGKLLGENLALAQKTEAWLKQALASSHQCTIADCLYCALDSKGQLLVFKKGETKKTP
ncbi:MAG TPA: DUF421 domain-containing protein [Bacillota bacterium]|nr:DUF421 domain-containing protein [Bacillota bacterium]HQE01168.1 DUF421 domain-containing protein [Bacillota bacterium]